MNLEVNDLEIAYPGAGLIRAPAVSVRPGEVVGLLGASGAGKTSVLRSIVGLERASRGDVRVGSAQLVLPRDVDEPAAWRLRRHVAAAFGVDGLRSYETTAARIRRLRRQDGLAPRRDLGALVGELGLTGLLDRLPGQLSTGQKARAGLLSTLCTDRPVLILDEFASNLDEPTQSAIFGALRGAIGDRACLIASHARALVLASCDRVYEFQDGVLERLK